MRQWIEYAVENYRSKNSFGFQLAKNLKARQIDTAIEQYARIVKPEEVVAILDTTVVKSGKSGFLLTDRYLYSSNEKEGAPVELMYLKSVSVREENNSYCILEYEDGRKRELYVSVFLDVADVLKMIAGKSMPPAAASTGRRAFLADESCPQTISRFISSPTAKKKITIRPSLISFSTVIPRGNTQSISPSGLCTISERSVSSR